MAELVDAPAWGAGGRFDRVGSSPILRILKKPAEMRAFFISSPIQNHDRVGSSPILRTQNKGLRK